LRLRRHAPTKGFAPGDNNEAWKQARRLTDSRADGGVGNLWHIGALAALFDIGELIAQRGDVAFGKAIGDGCHKRVCHAGSCTVREHIASASGAGQLHKPETLRFSSTAMLNV
jgi:hypothetical protein